jgi:hypothetical protein
MRVYIEYLIATNILILSILLLQIHCSGFIFQNDGTTHSSKMDSWGVMERGRQGPPGHVAKKRAAPRAAAGEDEE